MKTLLIPLACLALAGAAHAQEASGSLSANGKTATLRHVQAFELESRTEPGFLDVLVVISDRPLAAEVARDQDKLEQLSRSEGLAALRVRLDPDAKVLSAEPLHPAFTSFLSSAAWVRWEPRAYDEKQVAGRFHSDGERAELGQKWRYDVQFSAPIQLDPAALSRR